LLFSTLHQAYTEPWLDSVVQYAFETYHRYDKNRDGRMEKPEFLRWMDYFDAERDCVRELWEGVKGPLFLNDGFDPYATVPSKLLERCVQALCLGLGYHFDGTSPMDGPLLEVIERGKTKPGRMSFFAFVEAQPPPN